MQQFRIHRLAGFGVALAATLALVLVILGPTVAKASKPAPEPKADKPGPGPTPYTASATCHTWSGEICYANIDPIPAGKRFVVKYVTVVAYTDKASDQKVAVSITFVTGPSTALTYWRVNPVLQFQLGSDSANWYQASEKVLAFAEHEVAPSTSGQLYVTRYPSGGAYTAAVTMWATGYLEDM